MAFLPEKSPKHPSNLGEGSRPGTSVPQTFSDCSALNPFLRPRSSSGTPMRQACLDCCDTINLNVERTRPGGNANEDSCWRMLRKIPRIDCIHGRELFHRRAVHRALEHILER